MSKNVNDTGHTKQKNIRYISIDVFKGIAIILTILINATAYFDTTPAWNKGTKYYGLTYVDLVVTFFVFTISLTFQASFQRRLTRDGKLKTYLHFIRRSFMFIVIGFLITIQISPLGILFRWGTLQMLGFSSLFLLLFIKFNQYIRLLVSIVGISFHQILVSTDLSSIIYSSPHGGIIGTIAWGSMLLLSSVITENVHNSNKRKHLLIGGVTCIIFALIGNMIWGISRNYITLPFTLLSVGVASLVFSCLYNIFDVWSNNNRFLSHSNFISIMGQNTLILYILQSILKFVPYMFLPSDVLILFAFIFGVIMVLLNFFISYPLFKAEIILTF